MVHNYFTSVRYCRSNLMNDLLYNEHEYSKEIASGNYATKWEN